VPPLVRWWWHRKVRCSVLWESGEGREGIRWMDDDAVRSVEKCCSLPGLLF